MKRFAKLFAVASVLALAASFTGLGSDFGWGMLKPLSAILFGASFIGYLLAAEYERYDQEQKERLESAKQNLPGSQPVPSDEETQDPNMFISGAAGNSQSS